MRGKERRWKIVALLAVGIAIGVAMTATPAVGHVSGWVHNWNRHIKPRADARYFIKAQAEARYYNVGETVANATNATNATNAANATNANHATSADDIPDLSFQTLTLKNGWVGNCFGGGVPGIARSAQGVVHFRGEMCRTSGTDTNAFAVPAGFAPAQTLWITADMFAAHTGRIIIQTNGEVLVQDDPTATGDQSAGFTSLAGVDYTLPY